VNNTAIKDADEGFKQQISNQVSRITTELSRLEGLLKAGLVDRRVLADFRHAVDRARTTSWQVEKWLEGDERALSSLLVQERMRATTQMANQLAGETGPSIKRFAGADELKQAIEKLEALLR
jgi:hypothetical protein